MSVYASSQRGSSKKRGGGGTFALKHITLSDATKQHWRLPHIKMPPRQSNICLALGLLITAIVAVQLLLVHKQTAMHVPDLHPLETRQKAEANTTAT